MKMKIAQLVLANDGKSLEIQIYNGNGSFDYFVKHGKCDGEWVSCRSWELKDGYVHYDILKAMFELEKRGYQVFIALNDKEMQQ